MPPPLRGTRAPPVLLSPAESLRNGEGAVLAVRHASEAGRATDPGLPDADLASPANAGDGNVM